MLTTEFGTKIAVLTDRSKQSRSSGDVEGDQLPLPRRQGHAPDHRDAHRQRRPVVEDQFDVSEPGVQRPMGGVDDLGQRREGPIHRSPAGLAGGDPAGAHDDRARRRPDVFDARSPTGTNSKRCRRRHSTRTSPRWPAGSSLSASDIIDGEQIGPHMARIRAPSMRPVVFAGIQREDEDGCR